MSVREILERALDTLDVDDVVDDWDARKVLETAVREALAALDAEEMELPLDPTPEMVEAGAARLMSYEEGSTWPDSFTPIQQRAARNDAEKVWRSMVLAIPLPGQSGAKGSAGLREAREMMHRVRLGIGRLLRDRMPADTSDMRAWAEDLDRGIDAVLRADEEQSHE